MLWLHRDLEHSLPQSLVELQGEVFQIHYVDLTCSHRKLIHSLTAFPDRVLVTCDDDEIYEETWLERLYRDHLQFPGDVIAHECRRIAYGADGAPLPYRKWRTLTQAGAAGMDLLPIGYGGVLYPPGALMPEATDVDLFMRLAPKADDLWFKAMSFRKGTRVRRSRDPLPKPVGIIGSQWVSLQKTNVHEDANRLQWLAICEHFGIELEPRPAQRKAGPLLMLWLYFSSCWRLS
ncbi:hypothetical protein [Marinospirillum alkaliphilum]|uniref:Glycosyl transferase family 2 n=1 Tax=Marinospirillum alkaliphilum DSM 21637 TaxID=1122209 RepID=A0A1K1U8I7_9GAMM|nr:hypothetical protein [Marinospirillum alkaliphilum]SFX09120.1 hypothetical protein SAMN02745752_00501 [Marinospirillum alkaliphilum DSM 21637]